MTQEIINTIITSFSTSTVFIGLAIYFFKSMITDRLKNAIKIEYDLKLESHKAELKATNDSELEKYKNKLKLIYDKEVKQRELYENIVEILEDIFNKMDSKSNKELTDDINRMFARLALYAPDNVYLDIKSLMPDENETTNKRVEAKEFRKIAYSSIRKSLLGKSTELEQKDIIGHFNVGPDNN